MISTILCEHEIVGIVLSIGIADEKATEDTPGMEASLSPMACCMRSTRSDSLSGMVVSGT